MPPQVPTFPPFGEIFAYLSTSEPATRILRAEFTRLQLQGVWDYLVLASSKRFPGLLRESQNRGVLYAGNHYALIIAELHPTKTLYPFIGRTGPSISGAQEWPCLRLGMRLSPASDYPRKHGDQCELYVWIWEARPVKKFISLWGQHRDSLNSSLAESGIRVSFGEEDDMEPAALDVYRPKARKHWLRLTRTFSESPTTEQCLAALVPLTRVYHVMQGAIRRDGSRLRILEATAAGG